MKFSVAFIAVLMLLAVSPAFAAEQLVGDEQSFETGVTPGRWVQFEWPCVWSTCGFPPSGDTCTTGVFSPPLSGSCAQGPPGGGVLLVNQPTGAPGWGSKSAAIRNTVQASLGYEWYQSAGGIRISVDVVAGATYAISGWIRFATNPSTGWGTGAGMSIDTDGGTDPGTCEYGNGYGVTQTASPFDPAAFPLSFGDCLWSRTNGSPPSNNQQTWYGPTRFRKEIQATGNQLTLFLWAFSKYRDNAVLYDGISIDGPSVIPTPTPPPSAGVTDWKLMH